MSDQQAVLRPSARAVPIAPELNSTLSGHPCFPTAWGAVAHKQLVSREIEVGESSLSGGADRLRCRVHKGSHGEKPSE